MKKYVLSNINHCMNESIPFKIYDNYEEFQKGLIRHFSKMVTETKEDESNIRDGMMINFSFRVNVAESDEDAHGDED